VRVQSQHAPLVEVIYYVAEHVPVDPYRLPGVYTDCPLPHDPFFRVFPVRQIFPQDVGIDPAGVDLLARKLDPRLLETGVETPAACVVNRRDILIASPGFDWPTGVQFLPSTPVLGPVPSSIQGGTGFLGGLATRTVPFESCTEPSCVLRYNDQSATVEGVVTDSRCGTPVEGATVELSAPGAPGRTTTTEQDGRYRIGALGGGTTYAVLVTQPLWWPPGDPYARRAYEDLRTTITAQVATTTTRNLVLQRQVACP
jgi:hypothetical protein